MNNSEQASKLFALALSDLRKQSSTYSNRQLSRIINPSQNACERYRSLGFAPGGFPEDTIQQRVSFIIQHLFAPTGISRTQVRSMLDEFVAFELENPTQRHAFGLFVLLALGAVFDTERNLCAVFHRFQTIRPSTEYPSLIAHSFREHSEPRSPLLLPQISTSISSSSGIWEAKVEAFNAAIKVLRLKEEAIDKWVETCFVGEQSEQLISRYTPIVHCWEEYAGFCILWRTSISTPSLLPRKPYTRTAQMAFSATCKLLEGIGEGRYKLLSGQLSLTVNEATLRKAFATRNKRLGFSNSSTRASIVKNLSSILRAKFHCTSFTQELNFVTKGKFSHRNQVAKDLSHTLPNSQANIKPGQLLTQMTAAYKNVAQFIDSLNADLSIFWNADEEDIVNQYLSNHTAIQVPVIPASLFALFPFRSPEQIRARFEYPHTIDISRYWSTKTTTAFLSDPFSSDEDF